MWSDVVFLLLVLVNDVCHAIFFFFFFFIIIYLFMYLFFAEFTLRTDGEGPLIILPCCHAA